jgi:YVTN family beta-propeller protein
VSDDHPNAPLRGQNAAKDTPKSGLESTSVTGASPSEVAPSASGLQFRLLGPVEAVRDGALVDLGPRKQRAVLALLLLNANRVVPTERLIDDLWGDAAPETARSALQVYVAGLRKALGNDGAALRTRAPGYVLELEPGVLDLERFVQQRAEARSVDDDERRAALLHDALALWRDAPLAELSAEPFSTAAVAQLEQLRLGALEERIDADLALGRHAALVPELDALVAEHPYRERLRAQLMLALYQSGRQAEALEAYQAGRRVLSEQLGLEPGKELRQLEGAILRQDESLAVGGRVIPLRPAGDETVPLAPPSGPARRARSVPRRRVTVLAAILVGIVAAAAVALLRGGAEGVAVLPNSVAVIDAKRGQVVLAVPAANNPGPLAVGAGSVWVGSLDDRILTRIDLASRRVVKRIPLPATSTAIAFGAGFVWILHGQTGQISRVDPQFEDVTTERLSGTTLYFKGGGVDVGAGSIWVAYGDATLARVSPVNGRETGSALTGGGPAAVVVDGRVVWVLNTGDATLQRFDVSSFESGPVQPYTVGRRPAGLAVGHGSVWVASAGDDAVWRIDAGTRSAFTIPVGDGATAVEAGLGSIWVSNKTAGSVSQIDPTTNTVVREIDVGGATAGLAVADGLVWVAVQEP